MRRTLSLFLLGLVTCGAVSLSAEPKFVTAPVNPIPDQYIVVFQEGAVRSPERPSAPTVERLAHEMAAASKGKVLELWRYSKIKGFVAGMSSQAARALSNDSRVKFVEQSAWMSTPISAPIKDCRFQTGIYNENVTRSAVSSPQSLNCSDPDPQHSSATCIDNWGLDRIDSPLAIQDQDASSKGKYLFGATGAGVHIYILDTGAYTAHNELAGRLGLKVDVTRRDVNGEIIYGPTADVEDDKLNSHGTHVTAIAGGRTIGVAKGAILHPVRIYRGAQDPLQNIVLALMWIADHHGVLPELQGPAVASLSSNSNAWRNSASLRLAVAALNEAGILLVESAGNKKQDACIWTLSDAQLSENLPAEARMKIQDMVLVAGGMDEKDGRWLRILGDPTFRPEDYDGDGTIEFNEPGLCVDGNGQPIPDGDCGSNWGSCIDLWAPAAHIVSACHQRTSNQYAAPSPNGGTAQPANGFCRLSGTSMAAPHVAGVAALFLQNHPNATPAQVVTALRAVAARDKLCTDGQTGCNSIRGEGETTPTPGAPNLVLQSQFPTSGPPVAGDDSFDVGGGFLDIAYAGLLANDVDWSNFTLSVVALGAAGHGNVGSCCSGATFSYQPDPGYTGPDQFTYTISNGHGGTATGTVHLQVTGTGPVAMPDELSTVRNTSFTFLASELLSNDSSGAMFLNASAIPGTTLGIVQLEGVGPQDVQYRYFPPAGFTGSDQFKYTIQDSAGRQAIGSVVVTIGDPPVAGPDTLTTVTNVRVRFYASELLLNDTPGVEFINAGQPQLGSLTIAGVGPEDVVYDYYPPAGYIGTDTFPYTIRNSNGFQATGTVTVNIQDAVPVASFTSTCTGSTCSFNAGASSDDLGITSYEWNFGDGNPNQVMATGVSVSHTFAANGTYTIRLTVFDQSSQKAETTRSVTILILPRDAVLLSQKVLTTMAAGRKYEVSLTLKNTGTETWSPIGAQCGAYRLGSANPLNNSTWGLSRVELPAAVAPGGQVTLSFTVTAPWTPGTYNFQWQMVQECVTWFPNPTPNVAVTVTAAPPRDAQILSQDVPSAMKAGQSYPVSITVRNVGTLTWSPIGPQCNAYRLGSTNTSWVPSRADLSAPVAPGGEVTLNFTVTAPSTSGTYNFQWQMVQECVTWFGDFTPNVTVGVEM